MGPRRIVTRWGILGGIFDPVHHGHLAIAEQTREALDLDGVTFIPAGNPVHRDQPHADAEHRVRMLELATSDNPHFSIDRIEVDADRPSYTVDTLAALTAVRLGTEFVLIVSSETAALMRDTWHRPDDIADLATIAVVSRLGHADISREWVTHHFPGREDRFVRVATSHLGHSSTDIRARVAAGRSIRYLVPPAVESYISDNNLYGVA
ncbi:MAG: nicotinate-nucleotide adenylyltransferase [Candidatus Limnocylindrales bacterium]